MSYKNLILRYQLPLSELTPEDEYWLTIEQVVEDERATVGFVADTIDALFDTTLCVESQDEEPVVPDEPVTSDSFEDMDEVLDKIAEKTEVDMSACEMLRSGTYQTDLKIIRSHPDVPYTLRLSVGKIIKTVLSSEQVSVNQNVKNESFTVLPFPVQTGLRVSWLGQVIGKNGVITPPPIQALGNTLFWGVEVTGSLRAEFGTLYDIVTVEIPGVPNYVGSELGESQSANILAFYHYHVYRADINPPEVDEGLLEEVCGYLTSTGVPPDEDPEPEPPPEPVQQYGCIDYFPLPPFGSPVTEPWFFSEKCCVDGQHDGCRVRSFRLEGGKKLSDEIINRMTLEWPGPIEFIGLGPITPEGCGTRYEETVIRQQNCCEDTTTIVWDSENSVEVLAPGTNGWVFVVGGTAPYHWSVQGIDFTFDGHSLRNADTSVPFIKIYAGPLACGSAPIEVTDGCSIASGWIRATVGRWSLAYQTAGGLNGDDSTPAFQHASSFINAFDSPGATGVKTGIKGKYKVVQNYVEFCQLDSSFLTLEAAIERCALESNSPSCSIPWYHKTGGAFYDSSLDGRICGAISATWPEGFPNFKSGNLGFSNYTYIALPWYSSRGIWINVVLTQAYEWIC